MYFLIIKIDGGYLKIEEYSSKEELNVDLIKLNNESKGNISFTDKLPPSNWKANNAIIIKGTCISPVINTIVEYNDEN